MSSSPALLLRPVTVTVPATSANLGPGFDCLGLALELRNELVLHATGPVLTDDAAETEYSISVSGLDADKVPADRRNLAVEAAELLFTRIGCRPAALAMRMTNGIPVGSGLGSSSSAIIAGLLGANAIFDNPIPRNELLRMAVDIEGHPDNVAPALLGGLVLGVLPDDEIGPNELIVRQWDPPQSIGRRRVAGLQFAHERSASRVALFRLARRRDLQCQPVRASYPRAYDI